MKKNSIYDLTDKVITIVNRNYIHYLTKIKHSVIGKFDELNFINDNRVLYEKIKKLNKKYFLNLAEMVYARIVDFYYLDWLKDGEKKPTWSYTQQAMKEIDKGYNSVTKYVYVNELDRKSARFVESIIASTTQVDRLKETDKYLKELSRMFSQYAIEYTDWAEIKAYEDMGVKYVQWKSVLDDRECGTCEDRHNRVYRLSAVPDKPHYNCRCRIIPYKGKVRED